MQTQPAAGRGSAVTLTDKGGDFGLSAALIQFQTCRENLTALAALVVCGILHIVGSERDTTLVLDDRRQRVALEGPVAETLIGST